VALSLKKPATHEDLLRLPDHVVGEIVGGELHVAPRPASRHARAATNLTSELVGPFDRGRGGGPGGWVILAEPELHLGTDVLVPDLAGWRRTTMPKMPDAPFFELAPDWLCEVISPSTGAFDRAHKLPRYAEALVSNVWLIDPTPRTLEVFRLDNGSWRLVATYEGDAKVRAEPFEAIELELSFLWST
jgi:Uma2 family endonuclease